MKDSCILSYSILIYFPISCKEMKNKLKLTNYSNNFSICLYDKMLTLYCVDSCTGIQELKELQNLLKSFLVLMSKLLQELNIFFFFNIFFAYSCLFNLRKSKNISGNIFLISSYALNFRRQVNSSICSLYC